jgi:hypothetical protein
VLNHQTRAAAIAMGREPEALRACLEATARGYSISIAGSLRGFVTRRNRLAAARKHRLHRAIWGCSIPPFSTRIDRDAITHPTPGIPGFGGIPHPVALAQAISAHQRPKSAMGTSDCFGSMNEPARAARTTPPGTCIQFLGRPPRAINASVTLTQQSSSLGWVLCQRLLTWR